MLARVKVEEAEIDLYVTVGRLQPAPFQNAIASARHARVVHREAGQFQGAISFRRGADFGGTLLIDIETAIGKLPEQNRLRGFIDQRPGGRIPGAVLRRVHPELQENVIGFESSVGRQLGAPVSARILLRHQILRGTLDGCRNRSNQAVCTLNCWAHRVDIVVNPEAACASSPGNEKRTSSSTNSTSSNW